MEETVSLRSQQHGEITQRVSAAWRRQEACNRDSDSECSMEETGGMATEITQRVSAAWRRQEAWQQRSHRE